MHKQKIGILIATGVGAMATFLPWVHAPIIGSVPGSSGDGWITFILFGIAAGLCFIGKKTISLKNILLIIIMVSSGLAAAVGLYKIIDFKSKMSGVDTDNPFVEALTQTVGIGLGLYVVVIAGISVIIIGTLLKKSGSIEESKYSFEEVKRLDPKPKVEPITVNTKQNFNNNLNRSELNGRVNLNTSSNSAPQKIADEKINKEITDKNKSFVMAKYCSFCAAPLRENFKFCSKCGNKIIIHSRM